MAIACPEPGKDSGDELRKKCSEFCANAAKLMKKQLDGEPLSDEELNAYPKVVYDSLYKLIPDETNRELKHIKDERNTWVNWIACLFRTDNTKDDLKNAVNAAINGMYQDLETTVEQLRMEREGSAQRYMEANKAYAEHRRQASEIQQTARTGMELIDFYRNELLMLNKQVEEYANKSSETAKTMSGYSSDGIAETEQLLVTTELHCEELKHVEHKNTRQFEQLKGQIEHTQSVYNDVYVRSVEAERTRDRVKNLLETLQRAESGLLEKLMYDSDKLITKTERLADQGDDLTARISRYRK